MVPLPVKRYFEWTGVVHLSLLIAMSGEDLPQRMARIQNKAKKGER
jgi:hypothetical protein